MALVKKPELIVLRSEDSFASCIDYVMHLFCHVNRWQVRFSNTRHAAPLVKSAPNPRVILHYSTGDTTFDADEWTDHCSLFIRVPRGPFFGRKFLESPDLPEPPQALVDLADPRVFRNSVFHSGSKSMRLNFDMVAAAFWFLTRYEEYIISTPDEHGRFLCAHSLAPPHLYDQPLVSLWFAHLSAMIREHLKLPAPPPPRQTIALTHDVDLMRKYRGLRGARRALSTVVQSNVTDATGEMRYASLVFAGIRRDPYDSFDQLFALKDRIGAPSTFFLMGGGNTPYDGDYDLEDTHFRDLVMRIRNTGDEIGVHPSYDSYRSEPTIRAQHAAVSQAVGQQVAGSRQHYLRSVVPETWRALAGAGIRYDASLSFPDRAGFRCGWSGCLRPFDVERRTELPIIEVPLTVMDVTIANYEKVPAEHAVERVAKLLDASTVPGGAFVLLWHNILRDSRVFPGYWDSFEYFLFAAAGHARFQTLSKLCDEFEQPEMTS